MWQQLFACCATTCVLAWLVVTVDCALVALQVSAFVRAMLYDPEMRLNGGSVIAYDPCASAASEGSLLCTVLDLYSKGALPGGLQDISEDMVRCTGACAVCAHAPAPATGRFMQTFRVRTKHGKASPIRC